MAISRVKTWSSGEVLTASDLNAEFNNILSNASDLVSPFTKAISMGGFALNFDAANTMAITSSSKGLNLSSTTAINDVFTTVVSAATPDIWTAIGGVVNYTGTTPATGFAAAPQAGARRSLVCAGAAPFTAGANVLIDGYASGSTFTAAAGDVVDVIAITTTQFRLKLRLASGVPIVGTSIPRTYIAGLTYANNVADATNDIDISAGMCSDSTNVDIISLSAITKQSDVAWAVGSGNGGLDTGAVGNNDYYIWAIKRVDTQVTDALFSLSSTAPTMPTSYTLKKLIGWVKRTGGTIVAFHTYEKESGGLEMTWDVPTLDINLANTLTTARRTDAVKVPLNITTIAHLNVSIFDAGSASINWVCCPDQTDAAPSGSIAPLANLSPALGLTDTAQLKIRTSSTGTIAARSTLATCDLYAVVTMGFEWARRN